MIVRYKLNESHSQAQKIGTIVMYRYPLTLPNINQEKIRSNTITKDPPHLKCVATLPCETSGVLKATTENKTTSVTTHFKKVTPGNNVFISAIYWRYINPRLTYSNCHILQFLHQMFNVSALLLDDAFKPATPMTNVAINETLRQFSPLSDDTL